MSGQERVLSDHEWRLPVGTGRFPARHTTKAWPQALNHSQ